MSAAALSLVLLLIGPALSAEPSRGQMLYENHCQSCHSAWVHDREQRKVTTPQELRRRVASWSAHSGLDWSAEDIGDVADYLARTYYGFAE